jgi:hypothetical protein
MEHTHKYTVDFGHHKITALVTDMGVDQEPAVELVGGSLYGKEMDPHSLDCDDVINCVLYHHDMMRGGFETGD